MRVVMLLALLALASPNGSLAMEGPCGPLGTDCQPISSSIDKLGMLQVLVDLHSDVENNSSVASTVLVDMHSDVDNNSSTASTGTTWYCAIRHTGGDILLKKTYSLSEAQQALGTGSSGQQQAIIPMTGSPVTAGGVTNQGGDPHTLAKTWSGGSMWWWNWHVINSMRTKCSAEPAPQVHEGRAVAVLKTATKCCCEFNNRPYYGGGLDWRDFKSEISRTGYTADQHAMEGRSAMPSMWVVNRDTKSVWGQNRDAMKWTCESGGIAAAEGKRAVYHYCCYRRKTCTSEEKAKTGDEEKVLCP